MFGDWVEDEHLETILDLVRETPQWNYIFLTKNAKRYLQIHIPKNCWVGAKVDKQEEVKPTLDIFRRIKAPVRFLSCDPMVTWLQFSTLDCFDWIIVGARPKTKKRPAFEPPKMWITSLAKQATACGCKIYLKYQKMAGLRAYPGQDRG
jgi:protein gp37